MRKTLIILLALIGLTACHKPAKVTGVTTEAIPIDASLDAIQDTVYLSQLEPVKEELEKEMSIQIGYAPEPLWVRGPECPMLNWASDALWEAAKAAYTKPVDMAVVNMGGMRCSWPAGPITRQSVFELMPFDNCLVVLTLRGNDILDLCQSFADTGGQGVAGLRMKAVDGKLADVTIGGNYIDPHGLYTVATSDYLMGGADHMEALTRYVDCWKSDLLIRELYLDAVRSQDTIRAQVDGRMTLL